MLISDIIWFCHHHAKCSSVLMLQRAKPADDSTEARFTAALVNELSDELRHALEVAATRCFLAQG